ncbi:MAG: phage virion morphogenesis protein [Methylobacter sp.]|uniref:phage virion morphogenesis protein n=1 Tax=Methylobacter sp. TaxID=2051955 RepID=UPI0025878077|nr:phage virion morphogenesis protein [Methylobacter sp.]MCL7420843.1 phage virion morphogenesis protein [Methylobacter sp.]
MIEIEFNDRDVLTALQNLQHTSGNLRPALAEIGEALTESTKQRFSAQAGPNGQRWPANSQVTIERKGRDQPLIGETGSLMDAIHYNLIGDDTLEIGSPMEYAAMQQFGGTKGEFPHLWGNIPERPFLGVSENDKNEILSIISHYLASALE